jgi:hypothetical protein
LCEDGLLKRLFNSQQQSLASLFPASSSSSISGAGNSGTSGNSGVSGDNGGHVSAGGGGDVSGSGGVSRVGSGGGGSMAGECLAAAVKLHVNYEGGFGPSWELQHKNTVKLLFQAADNELAPSGLKAFARR